MYNVVSTQDTHQANTAKRPLRGYHHVMQQGLICAKGGSCRVLEHVHLARWAEYTCYGAEKAADLHAGGLLQRAERHAGPGAHWCMPFPQGPHPRQGPNTRTRSMASEAVVLLNQEEQEELSEKAAGSELFDHKGKPMCSHISITSACLFCQQVNHCL